MSHDTETGSYDELPAMHAHDRGSISSSIDASRHVNKALPWIVLVIISIIGLAFMFQSRINALNDRIGAMSDRISGIESSLSHQIGEVDYKANAATAAAFDAKTQSLLAGDHVRELRESMAAHGVTPLPTFPKRLE